MVDSLWNQTNNSPLFSPTEPTNTEADKSSVSSPSLTFPRVTISSRSRWSSLNPWLDVWISSAPTYSSYYSSFILKLCPPDGHFSFPSFLFIFPPSFHDSSKPNFLQKSFAFFPQVLLTRLVHISIFDCCFNRTRSVPPVAKENPPVAKENPTVVAPAEPDPEDAAATTSLLVRRYYYAAAATTPLVLRRC